MIKPVTRSKLICENLTLDAAGELHFAGVPLTSMAERYGTPLYLYDEARIRERCRTYLRAVEDAFDGRARVLYASKAASFKRLYEIMREEGMGVDVVSCGEIYTAHRAGFPLENSYFHSNNKTDEDIKYAIDMGVGHFVVDNAEELYAIDRIAGEIGISKKVLLRITPGIDPHTFAAVSTGMVDSKFGSAIETGQAIEITKLALSLPHIELCGFHCHIGSQIFDTDVYLRAADVMLEFVADVYRELGFLAKELDKGGGIGVRYISTQPIVDIDLAIRNLGEHMQKRARELGITLPTIALEPGRSIVADAGLTLYTVGTVKRIPGYKTYVSVDGGMTDNPRFALYQAPYTILPVQNDRNGSMGCAVVGRCCESGDIIQDKASLPDDIKRGELIACLTTGAYNYAMASNYNRIPRPAVVMIADGDSYIAVKRETPEHVAILDV